MVFPSAILQAYYCKNTIDVEGVAFFCFFSTGPGWTAKYLKGSNCDWKYMAGTYLP